jgi:hypothetical protein
MTASLTDIIFNQYEELKKEERKSTDMYKERDRRFNDRVREANDRIRARVRGCSDSRRKGRS